MFGYDNSMSRRNLDMRNTPGSNVAANIGGNGSTEGMTMWEADKLEREKNQQANLDLERKRDLFNARRQQANQNNTVSTQDILNNTGSMIGSVAPYAAAQFNAQNIANNAEGIIDRSNEREAALNVETTTTKSTFLRFLHKHFKNKLRTTGFPKILSSICFHSSSEIEKSFFNLMSSYISVYFFNAGTNMKFFLLTSCEMTV